MTSERFTVTENPGGVPTYSRKRTAAVRCFIAVLVFLSTAVLTAVSQDPFINEIEFAPFIVMPEELLHRFSGGEKDYLLVDIRSEERFAAGHIRGAVRIQWPAQETAPTEPSDPLNEPLDALFPTDIDLLIIDEAGEESFELLKYLLVRGYSRVLVVEGGMKNWPYGEHLEKQKP